jgi:hypothetical protein
MMPSLIKKSGNTLEKYEQKGILKRRFKMISDLLSKKRHESVLLTIATLVSNYNKSSATNIAIQIGKRLAFLLFRENLIFSEQMNIRLKFND